MPSQKPAPACVYCGSRKNLTTDHVVPLSLWRKFRIKRRILDNKSNRVTACWQCNQEKGAMTPAQWFRKHPEYKARFTRQARYLSNAVKQIIAADE